MTVVGRIFNWRLRFLLLILVSGCHGNSVSFTESKDKVSKLWDESFERSINSFCSDSILTLNVKIAHNMVCNGVLGNVRESVINHLTQSVPRNQAFQRIEIIEICNRGSYEITQSVSYSIKFDDSDTSYYYAYRYQNMVGGEKVFPVVMAKYPSSAIHEDVWANVLEGCQDSILHPYHRKPLSQGQIIVGRVSWSIQHTTVIEWNGKQFECKDKLYAILDD